MLRKYFEAVVLDLVQHSKNVHFILTRNKKGVLESHPRNSNDAYAHANHSLTSTHPGFDRAAELVPAYPLYLCTAEVKGGPHSYT